MRHDPSELKLHAAVRRHARWGPALHVSVQGLKRHNTESLAPARRSSASVRQKDIRWISHAIDYAVGTVGLRREAGPSPSAGRLPLRAFEGSKMIGVIGVEQAGPFRRAARRCLRELRGWGQDRRLRGYPLDLAKDRRRK